MQISTVPAADAIDLQGMHLTWFDHWLKGENNSVDTDPPAYIFVMGANVWRSESAWPPPGIQMQSYFLHSQGRANTLHGNGWLSLDPPRAGELPDRYLYNPINPVPTHCIRLTVSSSNFPAYARNLNTGGAHHEASEPRPALQTVLHEAAYPSCLRLPVAQR